MFICSFNIKTVFVTFSYKKKLVTDIFLFVLVGTVMGAGIGRFNSCISFFYRTTRRMASFYPFYVEATEVRKTWYVSSFLIRTQKDWNFLSSSMLSSYNDVGFFKAEVERLVLRYWIHHLRLYFYLPMGGITDIHYSVNILKRWFPFISKPAFRNTAYFFHVW